MGLLAILVHIVGYNMLYHGTHLKIVEGKGRAQLSLREPMDGCTPESPSCRVKVRAMTDLSYCAQYTGKRDNCTAAKVQNCVYRDGIISLKDLLSLADTRGTDLLDASRTHGDTLRYEGGAIHVQ